MNSNIEIPNWLYLDKSNISTEGMTSIRIWMDNVFWDGTLHRTKEENLKVAWKRLTCDIPEEYLPKSKEDFIRRGGRVTAFKSF